MASAGSTARSTARIGPPPGRHPRRLHTRSTASVGPRRHPMARGHPTSGRVGPRQRPIASPRPTPVGPGRRLPISATRLTSPVSPRCLTAARLLSVVLATRLLGQLLVAPRRLGRLSARRMRILSGSVSTRPLKPVARLVGLAPPLAPPKPGLLRRRRQRSCLRPVPSPAGGLIDPAVRPEPHLGARPGVPVGVLFGHRWHTAPAPAP